ncbi:hypothetical protein [Spirillospora sp. NPDC047279]|uniref:hypothetical protein n=1 Tax=Spirillospora sp. NPDC047279 TaxID=3155478 RepID=UPI003410B865
MPTNPDAQALHRLRADFPAYRVWRAQRYDGLPGDWVATLHDESAGIDPTVIRDNAITLREALLDERERAAQHRNGGR